MQKPYRGDYKPDYEKWKKIAKSHNAKGSIFFSILSFICVIYGLYKFNIVPKDFYTAILIGIILGVAPIILLIFVWEPIRTFLFGHIYWQTEAENEAEQRYQEDLDRYYHSLNAQDEIEDRKLARELKRKRAFNELDNESLIYQYSQLQAIQNQSNQQAYLFFQEAQKALRNNQRSSVEDALDKLEKAFGV